MKNNGKKEETGGGANFEITNGKGKVIASGNTNNFDEAGKAIAKELLNPSKGKISSTTKFLKCSFTREQLEEKGKELARLNTEIIAIENEAKATASNYKAQKDGKIADVEKISGHINTGFEFGMVGCEVQMHTPNTGMKTIVRKDNREIVEVVSMSVDELQEKLEFND